MNTIRKEGTMEKCYDMVISIYDRDCKNPEECIYPLYTLETRRGEDGQMYEEQEDYGSDKD